MKKQNASLVILFTLVALISYFLGFMQGEKNASAQQDELIRSGVVSWEVAPANTADWGEMRFFFQGETFGTTSALTAAAVVKPGESVHPAHRHAEEEYLILAKGSGTWHLNGKEFPAREGDVLYVEPWQWHGLINTSDEPLTFYVVRWNSKGVTLPPEPEGSHGR